MNPVAGVHRHLELDVALGMHAAGPGKVPAHHPRVLAIEEAGFRELALRRLEALRQIPLREGRQPPLIEVARNDIGKRTDDMADGNRLVAKRLYNT
jgi:hypothetical protein